MPELVEVEHYRRLADRTVGRTVAAVDAPDGWFLKGATTAAELTARLPGRTVDAVRRRGKLLLVDLDDATVLGLRFGMTGRLLLDDEAGVERLVYSSDRADPAWDRFGLRFTDGSHLVLRDPRRLGGVELEPDEDRLGPDAATVGAAGLRDALAGSTVALKARLLDQGRLAGVGNLIADETLWRAGLSPVREARSLDGAEVRRLHRWLRRVIGELDARGGSHAGDLHGQRHRGGHCPRDGTELRRDTVGGRTTYWCPEHQV